ncbi:ATP-dependent helicase HrpB [Streptomyces acidiscabies]|uniref:ATP-dependent helicase HrpB n=4 Tax=Streptomyces acidiscabies TaxID=42234 RepID=A0AAP6B5V8_9ACTN|nr:ATP-dependent helicase HrpB [Streptomyces acidiscabies]MBP5940286.1 ATP-dependent helicase HrpB [Streptomyces sp. LBUM 1476]MBZ3911517.1 ATP-dependent helicase HrpB [Streptomyces acidiscabies]MDX2958741.1 ATP-dependent helicase HrpB [Streptomyces acidiscabies]MDX3018179.1 ATP-dependent helicase HrpB [Streptomyces acidiscabies]MDX3791576.1 ATP-dependent helicase HrpB [Streptomyces acidiscabies]
MIRYDALDALPVRSALPALGDALDARGTAVLVAPPGTGKTTLVPLALAGLLGEGPARTVVVAEPRRIAARAAARRMAWLLGEEVGNSIGYTVRGERVVGPRTRVEVVTTGVLLQRLQRDQELAGVDVVVLDECHERHLDADTAAAFLWDVRETLRPELRLVAASATTDAQGWAELLGGAPVVEARGVSYPVETVWAPPARGVRPPHGTWVDPALLAHVASVVRRALAERAGDVLCFLPGVGEIARVAGQLSGGVGDVEVLQVHGRAPAAVQDAVLAPGARRRVVLATAVAESSLTVPGVRVVVDSGLAREPRVDHARGLSALATVRASRAAGRQRAGRAGREAPGTVYRCWPEAENARLPRFPAPEIKVADLAAFALQAACWGDPEAASLALLDPPPTGAMAAARDLLTAIGAVDPTGRATARGVRLARLGLHPRLGRALLDGTTAVGAERAAEVVALLSEEPPREYGDDLAAALRAARRGGDAYSARWRTEVRRLRSVASGATPTPAPGGTATAPASPTTDTPALITALAFPERLARLDGGTYLMLSGTRAELREGSPLRPSPWLAIAVADRPVGKGHARVQLATVVDEDTARWAAGALLDEREEVRWAGGDVVARRVERLGAVELAVRPLRNADAGLVRAALLEGLRQEGFGVLRWTDTGAVLRQRLAFLRARVGEPWPDVSDEALHARVDEWLEPELGRARQRKDLARIDAGNALGRLLPWASGEAGKLGELAPERIVVPSGSSVRVDYGDPERPVLAVKVQEMFGLQESPRVAGVPVVVHLLSPAGRPVAVTADLASFWRDGYRGVRAELRGRYPKHPWPEDPATAEPTRHTNARLGR